jgi:hypothetical protein
VDTLWELCQHEVCDCSDSNKTESVEKSFVWLTSTDECEWHGVGENMTVSCECYHICITMFRLCVQLVKMVVKSLVSRLVSFFGFVSVILCCIEASHCLVFIILTFQLRSVDLEHFNKSAFPTIVCLEHYHLNLSN